MYEEVECSYCANLEVDDDDDGFDYCPYWVSCGKGELFVPKKKTSDMERRCD